MKKAAEEVAWEDRDAQLERKQYIELGDETLQALVVTWVGSAVLACVVRNDTAQWEVVPYQAFVEIEEE